MTTEAASPGRNIGGTEVRAGTAAPPTERVIPGPDQESVWDYPRPPRVEPVAERIRVLVEGVEIAGSSHALRVLEAAGAPVYYVPAADVRTDLLRQAPDHSVCEFKGRASYHDLVIAERTIERAAWSYPEPLAGYEELASHFAFYGFAVDEAWVGEELSTPQPGNYYGGWVTSHVVGPFKGEPGTERW